MAKGILKMLYTAPFLTKMVNSSTFQPHAV